MQLNGNLEYKTYSFKHEYDSDFSDTDERISRLSMISNSINFFYLEIFTNRLLKFQ
jgi:hypothetical protein